MPTLRLIVTLLIILTAGLLLKGDGDNITNAQQNPNTPTNNDSLSNYSCRYRNATELKELLNPFLNAGIVIVADETNNNLILQGETQAIDKFTRLLGELDRPSNLRMINFSIELYEANNQTDASNNNTLSPDTLTALQSTFKFKNYQLLSTSLIKGHENKVLKLSTADHQISFNSAITASSGSTTQTVIELKQLSITQNIHNQSIFTFDSDISIVNETLMIIGGSSINNPTQAVLIVVKAQVQ